VIEGPSPTIPVVAAVIERDGRYLVGRRPRHKRHGGLWEFPGGKVHEGESDARAVARELSEELALTLETLGALLHQGRDPGSPYLIRFVSAEVSGEPRAMEHESIGWFTPAELRDLELAPSDEHFVQSALKGS